MSQPVANTSEFYCLLEESQLLAARILKSVRAKAGSLGEVNQEPRKLAATLVNSKVITAWQARRLLSGKGTGFYVGRYKLLTLLGSGGMGRVYLAEHLKMHQLVAIKILKPIQGRSKTAEKEVVARFAREAQAIAALNHPNIVQAFDFDEIGSLRYLVMEFVEGVDATTQLMKTGAMHWSQAADYICQAAAGLQHAHEAGLVHRDVKPANLLVSKSGQVKIVDLGLVSCLPENTDDSLTVDEFKLGTVDFIAPEQAVCSHDVDARADIYSLGGTFYRLASGKLLFPELNTTQKLLAHQLREPKSIAELVPDMPSELVGTINRMLAKDRNDRFATCAEIIDIVRPFAKSVSPPYDPKIIPHTRARIEPFLRRGPATFDAESTGPDDVPEAQPVSSPELIPADSMVFSVQDPADSGSTSLRIGASSSVRARKRTRSPGLVIGGVLGVLAIAVIAVLASQIGETTQANLVGAPRSVPDPGVSTTVNRPSSDVWGSAPSTETQSTVVIAAVMPNATEDYSGDGKINGRDEYVKLTNTGTTPVDISGYELSDSVGLRHMFEFRTILAPGESIRVLTDKFNSAGGQIWQGVWNNTGDEITLSDAVSRPVDSRKYVSSEPGKEIIFQPPAK